MIQTKRLLAKHFQIWNILVSPEWSFFFSPKTTAFKWDKFDLYHESVGTAQVEEKFTQLHEASSSFIS